MIDKGMEPLTDTEERLKASYCHSLELQDCDEFTKEMTRWRSFCEEDHNKYFSCLKECNRHVGYDSETECWDLKCSHFKRGYDECESHVFLLSKKYDRCVEVNEKYPNIIRHTCYTWPGNSGGGFVSQQGDIYGIVSYGIEKNGSSAFYEREGRMASAIQFESKIKELREMYSSTNSSDENLSKLPKEFTNVGAQNDAASSSASEVAEYQSYQIGKTRENLQQELSEQEPDLLNAINNSNGLGMEEKLQLINRFITHVVKTEELEKLQQAYEAAKAKEHSLGNRMLGGLTMAATGIGGMMLAQGLAEKSADADAEMYMKAYLETFVCKYTDGKSVKGGTENVELPGGNELLPLYTEYVNLANDLKVRKEALGMRPGIEAEQILESMTSGLYDDMALGKTGGAYASLARALQDPEGEDAKLWAEQKDKTKSNLTTGASVAGVGAVGGIVGNAIINKDSD